MTPSDCAALLDGPALGARYTPAPKTPAHLARLVASALAQQAEYIAGGDDLAHRTTGLQRALTLWARACDVETRAGRGLPEWPRWHDVQRNPWELQVLLARVEGGAAAVERLGEDVAAWARQWDGQQEEVTT